MIFDPLLCLSSDILQAYVLLAGAYEKRPRAEAFPTVAGLQLQLWEGAFEGQMDRWLRWAREGGAIIPTGAERADAEAARADAEAARANALAAKLRELGIDPG